MIFLALLLRSSDPSELLLFCVLGFCIGIGLFVQGFRLLQRRRLILDTPASKIRSASMGMVEVSGLAVGPFTMIAPITARPCYYYRTVVWEWKQEGKNKKWVKVAAECMHVPFFLDDNTGRLLVDPRGADLDLHRDFQQEFNNSFFSSGSDAPGSVNSFLARHGIVTSNKIKMEEYCIKPKNSLFILGTLADNPGIEVAPHPVQDTESVGSFSSGNFSMSVRSFTFSTDDSPDDVDANSLAQRLATQSDSGVHVFQLSTGSAPTKTSDMTQQQIIAAALTKAGISNPAAWNAARLTAPGLTTPGVQVITDPAAPQTSAFEAHPPVVLMKGTNNKTFLISWRSQQEIARTLGWKCALMIWGGPALALISLYFFLGIKNLF